MSQTSGLSFSTTQLTQPSDNPFWDLSEYDPNCRNSSCHAFDIGFQADQQRYSNLNFPTFAKLAVSYFCGFVLVFCMIYCVRLLVAGGRRKNVAGAAMERFLACWRMFMYRRPTGKLARWLDVSLGQFALLAITTVFFMPLPFYQGYFLRKLFRYGSPPLSVRCAFLISALLPVNLALAGKINLISVLTGVSYAKLNIWHRFISYLIYYFAVVHMIPHLVAPMQEGGYAELAYLLKTKQRELSGIMLFTTFTLLVLASLPVVRARFYEAFKVCHIILAISFFSFFMWHVRGEWYTPAFYFIALAILVFNFAARFVYRNRMSCTSQNFVSGLPTTLEALPCGVTRMTIRCPYKFEWKPGQHCYVTVPSYSKTQSHPFTIASVSQKWSDPLHTAHEVVLLIRKCKGFTKHLSELVAHEPSSNLNTYATLASSNTVHRIRRKPVPSTHSLASWSSTTINTYSSVDIEAAVDTRVRKPSKSTSPVTSTRTWIDGPYGDHHAAVDLRYQGVCCIAGGSGITASLPWLTYVSRRMLLGAGGQRDARGSRVCKTRSLSLVWSVRKVSWLQWAEEELIEAMRNVHAANNWNDGNCSGWDESFRLSTAAAAAASSSSLTLSSWQPTAQVIASSSRASKALGTLQFFNEKQNLVYKRRKMHSCRLNVCIYVTQADSAFQLKAAALDLYARAGVDIDDSSISVQVVKGRPAYSQVLPNLMETKRNIVFSCGPLGVKNDAANAISRLQTMVLQGKTRGIALHSEAFGW